MNQGMRVAYILFEDGAVKLSRNFLKVLEKFCHNPILPPHTCDKDFLFTTGVMLYEGYAETS
jgi:hypothetical protein